MHAYPFFKASEKELRQDQKLIECLPGSHSQIRCSRLQPFIDDFSRIHFAMFFVSLNRVGTG